jgi:hydrophobic/amphiphilic exporter-1 (mainly G- bacteria), HAE1 family
MFSRYFIERPILSNVIALVIVLIGAVCLVRLPIAQYPNVTPPTVSVTTRYPGASAKVIIHTIALPIEQQVNGVPGMIYMQSTSASDGAYSLIVTFEIGTDPDMAQVLVQNRVASALAQLPEAVQIQGVTTQKQSTAVLMFLALTSPDKRFDSLFLANYGVINLQNELARLPGVGNVTVYGAGQYAMRVWMNPNLLQSFGLTPEDVVKAIQQQSQEVTAGVIGMPPAPKGQNFQYTVNVAGRFDDVRQFENIVVKADNANGGQITRIKDIGRVELGAQTYSQSFTLNNLPSAGIGIYLLPAANALDVAKLVRARMDQLAKNFPPGLVYSVPFDTTVFVQASIKEVYITLIEAGVLVLIVILVFLQDWRATLVPATTVPVTIIGAFAAMAALGFTVNLSTLFALVLVIGIVVDDAIVIVEGVARHIEGGMPRREAAVKAMGELFGPIIGITLVLMSVFLPAAFLPGLTGQLYQQFALVIAATALISAINAVTLKPTQCALWLRAEAPPERRNLFYRVFNRVYDAAERGYTALIRRMVHHSGLVALLGVALIGVAFFGLARLPTAFIPLEDQGYLIVSAQLPDAASLERTQRVMEKVTNVAKGIAGVDQVVAISGISVLDNSASLPNAGVAYVVLKSWDERYRAKGQDLLSLFKALRAALQQEILEANTTVIPPPPIQGIGNSGGFTMEVELRDGSADFAKLQSIATGIVNDAKSQSAVQTVFSPFRASAPQLEAIVDRNKAETLGVTVGQVFEALGSYIGSTYVGQINKFGRVFQVYVQSESQFRTTPGDIAGFKIKTPNGQMAPLGTLVQVQKVTGPSLITLYNLYPAATIAGTTSAQFSSGETMGLMEQIAGKALPPGASFDWTAMSYQEKVTGNQIYYVFALAILLVYLVLAGQYESLALPLAVILSVPLALLGTVGALTALGVANNLYTQIGLILLIALSSKNAILIVEYARDLRAGGAGLIESAVDAARLRFRPILMTSFAFILGVLPLVLATGAGASARKSIGIAVFSGMLASTCLALLFVPSFYVVLKRFEEWRQSRKTATKLKGEAGSSMPL